MGSMEILCETSCCNSDGGFCVGTVLEWIREM